MAFRVRFGFTELALRVPVVRGIAQGVLFEVASGGS